MKTAFLTILIFASTIALADNGTTNDLPKALWICKENVADGYKVLKVSKDQFGEFSADVVQKDQISGDSNLASFVGVSMINKIPGVATFSKFERYGAIDLLKNNMFSATINITGPNKGEATLSLVLDGQVQPEAVQMTCSQK